MRDPKRYENLERMVFDGVGEYGIPTLKPVDFDGEPTGGTVAVSSVGCMQNKKSRELFLAGYKEMVKKLHPTKIIFYGQIPEECTGNIVRIKAFQEKFKEASCDGC